MVQDKPVQRTRLVVGAVVAFLLLCSAIPLFRMVAPAAEPKSVAQGGVVPGELAIQLNAVPLPGTLASLAHTYGAVFADDGPDSSSAEVLTAYCAPAAAAGLAARLRLDPRVEAVAPQRLLFVLGAPNDPLYSKQWNLKRIHVEAAWTHTQGKGAVVAVIDTGVAFENDSTCTLASDMGSVKFVSPWNFVGGNKHAMDDNGHGTHVAATIAESTNNGIGAAGIAYRASIMPLKVLTQAGSGRLTAIASAIRYAADHGASVINMSLGTPFPDPVLRGACKYAATKGVVIVCAAGNSGAEGVGYPAAYPYCVAVSAVGPTGALAPYSSWGKEIAIAAPGGDKSQGEDAGILQNTYLHTGRDPATGKDTYEDGYFAFQGTSMASPHVAATAALVESMGIHDVQEVRAILSRSAARRDNPRKYGAGELDAGAATKLASRVKNSEWTKITGLAALWLVALGWPGTRARRMRRATAVAALCGGVLLPDLLGTVVGFGSIWNLAGHSVALPLYWLIMEADTPGERWLAAWGAAGIALHMAGDLVIGISPWLGGISAMAIPFFVTNIALGAGAALLAVRYRTT